MVACQGRRYILVRGSGLDLPPQWLLPTASRSQGEAAGLDNGLRMNGALSPRSLGNDGRAGHGFPGSRADRAA
jgi:hypothetical protein